MALTSWCQDSRPLKLNAAMAPSSTKTVCTSALRGIWPFLMASSSLRCVGCSVFSPVCSAISSSVQKLADVYQVIRYPPEMVGDVLRGNLQRETKNDQAAGDADAEALREDIHLRHGPAHD